MTDWINSKYHLPETPGEYLVYISDPEVCNGEYDSSYVTTAFYDKKAGLWIEERNSSFCANLSDVNTSEVFYVSHWASLPQPPKEDKP